MRFNNLFEFPLAYDHPSDAVVLTQHFHFQLPSQILESFTICPLPDEISSWVCQVLQLASSSLMASSQEAAFEDVDRSWRRWTGFLARAGYRADPFLLALPSTDTELVARAFLSCVRNSKWCTDGTLGLPHGAAVLSGTVRKTTGHMAASFRDHLQWRRHFPLSNGSPPPQDHDPRSMVIGSLPRLHPTPSPQVD